MAKASERLHIKGVRKRTGKASPQTGGPRRKRESPLQRVMADLTKLFSDATGASSKRKGQAKQAATKKQAATRQRNARRRSMAAKKAAGGRGWSS